MGTRALQIIWALSVLLISGLILPGCSDSTKPDEEFVNRVYLPRDLEVRAGDTISIPVYFENAGPIAAISLPLRFPSSVMRCDSVSLIGSRCNEFLLKPRFISADTIQIGLIDTVGVTKGRGLMARLYFWVHGNAPDTLIEIGVMDNLTLPFGFADGELSSEPILPAFESGILRIRAQE